MLVLGDAMADWLACGLEDAYSERPAMGVIRKHKTISGLIKYQPKGDPADWAAAAKGILATEKPAAIVVMLGLNDRMAIREPAVDKSDSKPSDKRSTRRTPKPSRRPSLETKNHPARSRMVQRILPQSRRTNRSIPNCPRTMMIMHRPLPRRRRGRARPTAFMSFARNAGSNSTPGKSTR